MDRVKVCYDAIGRTLSVWIGDPESEDVCEEAGDDTILIKDARGAIIGLEKLNVAFQPDSPGLTVEVIGLPGRT